MDYNKLNGAISTSGIPKSTIAKKIGMSRESIYNKCSGKREFTVSEMSKLVEVLHLSNVDACSIFFGL